MTNITFSAGRPHRPLPEPPGQSANKGGPQTNAPGNESLRTKVPIKKPTGPRQELRLNHSATGTGLPTGTPTAQSLQSNTFTPPPTTDLNSFFKYPSAPAPTTFDIGWKPIDPGGFAPLEQPRVDKGKGKADATSPIADSAPDDNGARALQDHVFLTHMRMAGDQFLSGQAELSLEALQDLHADAVTQSQSEHVPSEQRADFAAKAELFAAHIAANLPEPTEAELARQLERETLTEMIEVSDILAQMDTNTPEMKKRLEDNSQFLRTCLAEAGKPADDDIRGEVLEMVLVMQIGLKAQWLSEVPGIAPAWQTAFAQQARDFLAELGQRMIDLDHKTRNVASSSNSSGSDQSSSGSVSSTSKPSPTSQVPNQMPPIQSFHTTVEDVPDGMGPPPQLPPRPTASATSGS